MTPADAWLPIASAPRDGSNILGRDKRGDIAETWFNAPSSRTREWRWRGPGGQGVWFPKHWQPLPPPPEATDGQEPQA